MWSWYWLDVLSQDLRYALRTLRRSPAFTLVAVTTLALGIGANTAIFSLMDAVLLRMVPVERPDQLYFLAHESSNRTSTSSNYPLLERYRSAADVFNGIAAYSTHTFKVSGPGGIELVSGQFVSGNYHSVLGVPLVLGRGFTSEPDTPTNVSSIAVISEGYWTRRFDRDTAVIGQTVDIDERTVTIIGVSAASFRGLEPGRPVDLTLPVSVRVLDQPDFLNDHSTLTSMPLVGRLRTGVSEEQARSVLDTIFRQYMSEPDNRWVLDGSPERYAALLPAGRGSADLRTRYTTSIRVLMMMVGIVLLIACANVASLLLARSTTRRKEVALRTAVGAGRSRLVQQFLTESTLLALCGGAAGLLLAMSGTEAITSLFRVGRDPILLDVAPNLKVLAFTITIATLAGVTFGLVPAIRATGIEIAPALKADAASDGPRSRGVRGRPLVVCQIALCVVLIVGAGLLVRSLRNLTGVDAGFERDDVLLFSVDAGGTAFPLDRLPTFCDQLVERLKARPAVLSTSCSTLSPIDTKVEVRGVQMPGIPERQGLWTNVVTPDYFETLGVALLRGRHFSASDSASSRKVAIINQATARRYFSERDPLGRTFAFGITPEEVVTIVGIAQDARQRNLRDPAPEMVYTPLTQLHEPKTGLTVEIRTAQNPSALTAAIREDVRALSPDMVVSYVRTMQQQIDASLVRESVLARLAAGFGFLALVVTCVGLYGSLSYDVARRRREIGIRMALGAARREVLWQVLRQTLVLSTTGVAIGLAAAVATTHVVSSLLFDLSARDPLTLVVASAVLLTTSLVAGYLPARRAATVDPMVVLRAE